MKSSYRNFSFLQKRKATFTGINLSAKGELSSMAPQKSDSRREKLFEIKQLDVSVLYCHPAAIFAVVVVTDDSLNPLHGP